MLVVESEQQALRPAGWDDAAAEIFLAQVAAERLSLARQRFAGHDPVVKGPTGARTAKALARLLAADREGALVAVGEDRVNPAEDRAEAALHHAIRALTGWSFDTARRELAEAAAVARTPSRQQRIGAIRAISGVARAVVFTPPGGRLRGEDNAARAYLAQTDELPPAEREHYAGEIGRLIEAWKTATNDDGAWRAWAVMRGRLALRTGADESALAWALRAWDRQDAEAQGATELALAALLDAARAVFRPLADGNSGQETKGDDPQPARAADVLLAVAAALAAREGQMEPYATTLRFAFVPYHAAPVPDADEVAT